jgi:uncharacterized membrane protein YgcG
MQPNQQPSPQSEPQLEPDLDTAAVVMPETEPEVEPEPKTNPQPKSTPQALGQLPARASQTQAGVMDAASCVAGAASADTRADVGSHSSGRQEPASTRVPKSFSSEQDAHLAAALAEVAAAEAAAEAATAVANAKAKAAAAARMVATAAAAAAATEAAPAADYVQNMPVGPAGQRSIVVATGTAQSQASELPKRSNDVRRPRRLLSPSARGASSERAGARRQAAVPAAERSRAVQAWPHTPPRLHAGPGRVVTPEAAAQAAMRLLRADPVRTYTALSTPPRSSPAPATARHTSPQDRTRSPRRPVDWPAAAGSSGAGRLAVSPPRGPARRRPRRLPGGDDDDDGGPNGRHNDAPFTSHGASIRQPFGAVCRGGGDDGGGGASRTGARWSDSPASAAELQRRNRLHLRKSRYGQGQPPPARGAATSAASPWVFSTPSHSRGTSPHHPSPASNSTAPRPSHAEWGAARGMLSAEGAQTQLYELLRHFEEDASIPGWLLRDLEHQLLTTDTHNDGHEHRRALSALLSSPLAKHASAASSSPAVAEVADDGGLAAHPRRQRLRAINSDDHDASRPGVDARSPYRRALPLAGGDPRRPRHVPAEGGSQLLGSNPLPPTPPGQRAATARPTATACLPTDCYRARVLASIPPPRSVGPLCTLRARHRHSRGVLTVTRGAC